MRALISLTVLLGVCFQTLWSPVMGQAQSDNNQKAQDEPVIPEWLSFHGNIAYVPGSNNPKQMLDLYLPAGHKAGKLPLVIFVHGGGWHAGDKTAGAKGFAGLVRMGFACASLNYRFTDEARFPAQIYDVKAAVRWLRAHAADYGIDPSRFAAWGKSAGGHLVALLGTSNGVKELEGNEGNEKVSSAVQAVCDEYGPTDFSTLDYSNKQAAALVAAFLGALPKDDPRTAHEASPVSYVSKEAPPFLIVHGEKDPLVPVAQSRELAADLKQAGADVDLEVAPQGGHGSNFPPEVNEVILKFFQRTLQ